MHVIYGQVGILEKLEAQPSQARNKIAIKIQRFNL